MRFWSNTESSDTAVAVVIPNEERDLSRFVLREKSVLSVKSYYVYVLTNWNQRVMYVGVTSDLKRRIHEHQNKLVKGFTEKYNVNKLVYYEQTNDVITALAREKESGSGGAKKGQFGG